MAMVRLQFPFEDEEGAIDYLKNIIENDNYDFEALIIKWYLQYYYYRKTDDDFYRLINWDWKSSYKKAIVKYIMSCVVEKESLKEKYILESIKEYPKLVYPYEKLGNLYYRKGLKVKAKECFMEAVKNIKTTEIKKHEVINKQVFIDEYITGVSMSEVNLISLKKKLETSHE
ncbi:MAG: hypothetical protein II919_03100 [Lachnospiraceae bacterium]|nr:hypothetical protein [Lachnospiraceae bacterium]